MNRKGSKTIDTDADNDPGYSFNPGTVSWSSGVVWVIVTEEAGRTSD